MTSNKDDWVVYLTECSDKTLYCGITNNIISRLKKHNSGKGAKYTRGRRPVKLVCVSKTMSKSEALKLEHRVKSLKKQDKKTYIENTLKSEIKR
jgi:putative endonuclease